MTVWCNVSDKIEKYNEQRNILSQTDKRPIHAHNNNEPDDRNLNKY